AIKTANETKPPIPSIQKKARILIAEDNEINARLASRLLDKMGHESQVASNGTQALQLLFEQDFDLVLMDCHMPGMDGFEATESIRKSGSPKLKKIPIIAMTALAIQGDRELCLARGMDDYLSKPIDPTRFTQVITHWIEQGTLQQTVSRPEMSFDPEKI